MTYSELKRELDVTWADKPDHVRALATRYYIGADKISDLNRLATVQPCHKHAETRPALSAADVNFIIQMR